MNRIRLLLFLLGIGFYSALNAQFEPTCDSSSLIRHRFYSLCYNETTEQANWVYYFNTPERLKNKISKRSDRFKTDPIVSTGSASPADYKGSGFDRGHLCPAGDMGFDSIAMDESFYMSNMCPQFPGFNRGIWNALEQKVRTWTLLFDTLFVITGPVFYDTTYSCIGDNKVAIPDECYKVLLGKRDTLYQSTGFIIPNVEGLKNPLLFKMTVDQVELKTGIDFFPALDDCTEAITESDNSALFR